MSWFHRHLPVVARFAALRSRRAVLLAPALLLLLAVLPGCLTRDPGLGGTPPVTWVVLHEADRARVTWVDRDGVAWMRALERGSGLCRRVALADDEAVAFFDEADSIVRAPAALAGDDEPAEDDVAPTPLVDGALYLVRADGSVIDAASFPRALRPGLERLRDGARSFGSRGSDTIVEPPAGATIVDWSPVDAPTIGELRERAAPNDDA